MHVECASAIINIYQSCLILSVF